jgi:iron complex outermembrane receptor protein
MKKHRYFCGCSALAAILSLHAIQAQAADQPASPPATASPPPAAAASSTVSDLVVTAERREQRLESVPAAISAYGAEQRALVGISSTTRRAWRSAP